MDFCIYDDILDIIWITDKNYYILNSQNQVNFYVYIRPVFPGPVKYTPLWKVHSTGKSQTS